MSIFFPYNITEIVTTLEEWLSIDLSGLTNSESVIIMLLVNIYFFILWGFIMWCILKGINWVYERLF